MKKIFYIILLSLILVSPVFSGVLGGLVKGVASYALEEAGVKKTPNDPIPDWLKGKWVEDNNIYSVLEIDSKNIKYNLNLTNIIDLKKYEDEIKDSTGKYVKIIKKNTSRSNTYEVSVETYGFPLLKFVFKKISNNKISMKLEYIESYNVDSTFTKIY